MYYYLSDFKCPLCGAVLDCIDLKKGFHNPVFINQYPSVCENQGKDGYNPVAVVLQSDSLINIISESVRKRYRGMPEKFIRLAIEKEIYEQSNT